MCGITGFCDLRGRREPDRALLRRMNDSLRHRGPDGSGEHFEPGVALGHRRLSIIDLATGQQPLYNEDRSVVVVFNGEIYNYQTLIPQLQALGHTFHTRSDTEVIVHGWEAWGERCVERFRGMFAFALWDTKQEKLFLARDRLGVKPLYYALLPDGHLVFGSELKSLLRHPGVSREIDARAVEEYFALGYTAEPRTIFQSVAKLPPGHTLVLKRGEAAASTSREYWDVRFTLDQKLDLPTAMEELERRLEDSIRLRMISEVPLGAFLSGGVDSSAVVATMARISETPVNTCSMSFDDPKFDESRFAEAVANQHRARHFVERVASDDFDLIDQLAQIYDEPYADSSAIPTYRVCRLARKRVTVALSGDGGDESFGGYRRYRLHCAEERWRSVLPLATRRRVFGLLGRLYPKADWAPRVLRAKTTFQGLARSTVEAYLESVSIVRQAERRELFSPALRSTLGGYRVNEVFERHAGRAGTDDPLALVQYLDLKTYLIGDINTKVDRASMAHSLEVREPLMDHPLVEWLASLPSTFKIRDGEGKFLLKKTFEKRLPHDVLYRPKMGFAVPLAGWFRGPLRDRVRDAALGSALAESGLFDQRVLGRMVEAHQSGRRDFSACLWTVLMFEAFLRNVLGAGERLALRAAG
ncbi:MAG: XrtA/PEP-CTERM system amidotransferase [Steroidobacteraceae bacterium]